MNDETSGCALFVIIGVVGMSFFTSLCGDGGSSTTSWGDIDKRQKAEQHVKSKLNYPSSYKLQGYKVDGDNVILEYKAKNALGQEKTIRETVYGN